tara:strand:+ start:1225 stop:2016 length:792 start_codon:yes stop_codon:yes gene_type:complete
MIYIIIVNYNSSKLTEKCIDSVIKSTYKKFKIVVIDNFSKISSIKYLKKLIDNKYNNEKIHLIENSFNKGYSSALNIGINYAKQFDDSKYFFILNSDIILHNHCIENLIKNYTLNSIITPAIYDYNNQLNIQSLGCTLNKIFLTTKNIVDYDKKIDYLPGTALFFSLDTYNIVGMFPENYFMYYEDVDWSLKALSNKIKLIVNRNAKIYHLNSNNLTFYLKARYHYNRIILCKKYYIHRLPIVIIYSLIAIIKISIVHIFSKK